MSNLKNFKVKPKHSTQYHLKQVNEHPENFHGKYVTVKNKVGKVVMKKTREQWMKFVNDMISNADKILAKYFKQTEQSIPSQSKKKNNWEEGW